MREIESGELLELMGSGKSLVLIDVRQPEEFAAGSISNALLFPLMEIPERIGELKSAIEGADECVVYCRVGGRSQQAISWLEEQGISDLINLSGGINAFAEKSDCGLQAY
jgi:adenylyltransferase/sulfurtransferase